MKRSYLCDPIRFMLACIGMIVFAGLTWGCATDRKYLHTAFFAVAGLIYVYLAVKNSSIIHIDEEKVEKRILGKAVLIFKWDSIKDVGFVNKRFIYFSKEEMKDDDRYRMWFNWPPTDRIYFRAGRRTAREVETQWNRRGKLFVRYDTKSIKSSDS